LATVLTRQTRQGKLGDETEGLYKRSLAISIRNEGPDGSNTAIGNKHLGLFHYRLAYEQVTVDLQQMQLLLAKSYFEEEIRIYLKIFGPTHLESVQAASNVADISRELSEISQT
jgi:hypothetical protein